MSKLYPVLQFGKHWLHRVNQHSLHSPFLYSLYTECLKADDKQGFESIEALRQKLLRDHRLITVEDMGAGSRLSNAPERKVSGIARHASSPAKFSRLLARLITRTEGQTVIELGTSLGLNTLHMALANSSTSIYTFEGSAAIAAIARENFEVLNVENITVIEGNIDEKLGPILAQVTQVDLAYMDANHRYEPTLRYFDQLLPRLHPKSIVVVDDIHWSAEMNRAWQALKARPEVSLSLDLFEGGILFFDPALQKEHYVLAF